MGNLWRWAWAFLFVFGLTSDLGNSHGNSGTGEIGGRGWLLLYLSSVWVLIVVSCFKES
jgi:hypothetical protein